MSIYEPAEDSYLLENVIKDYLKDKNKNLKILDMGAGSGIQAQTCKNLGFNNILCADISREAIESLENKKFNAVKSDLFSNINKKSKFDLIIFNPPYLPEDKDEPKDSRLVTTAGKKGYEIIVKFLKQAKIYLKKEGIILLLVSSLSKPEVIEKQAKTLDYNLKQVANQKLFFEELFVCEIRKK